MTPNILFNGAGRLRAGWRFLVFSAAAILFAFFFLGPAAYFALAVFRGATGVRDGRLGILAQSFVFTATAILIGWLCCRFIEGLPLRSLGVTARKGWLRDALLGALLGGLSITLAAAICTAAGSYTFILAPSDQLAQVAKTLVSSLILFTVGAVWEEAVFRGYPLQTLLRSWPVWIALLPSSALFAFIHLDNPNAAFGFTFLNTLIAGAWLAVAYFRTRTLWFATGLHFGWNYTMGSLLGLPVSGITSISPAPVLRAADTGPTWLTGGHYGIEGGIACTFALIVSTIFILRTRLLHADEELKQMTDNENSTLLSNTFVENDSDEINRRRDAD